MEVPFVPLTLELAHMFDRKRDELPEATRELIAGELILDSLWDSISPDQRRDATAQWDYQHDPATEQERQHFWNIWCEIDELETEVERLKELRPTSYEGDYVKKNEIRQLEDRIGLFKKSLDEPHLQGNDEQEAAPFLQISPNVPADKNVKTAACGFTIEGAVDDPHVEQPSPATDPRVPVQGNLEPVAQTTTEAPVSSEPAVLSNGAKPELKDQSNERVPLNCLVHMGDFWKVRFNGKEALLQSTDGLHLLRILLRRPHKGHSVYELQTMLSPVDPSLIASAMAEDSEDVDSSEELNLDGATGLGPTMDSKGLAVIKAKLKSLQETKEDRLERFDTKGAEKAQHEIEQIISYILGAQGLGGKARRIGGGNEVLRSRMGQKISRVKKQVGRNLPELERHLTRSLRAGAECIYDPDPKIDWIF